MSGRSLLWLLVVLGAALVIGALYREDVLHPQGEAERLPVASGCDPADGPCWAGQAQQGMQLVMPEGARLMQTFPVELRLRGRSADAVSVDFRMQGMDMGVNRVSLQAVEPGYWRGEALLPVCSSGRADWLAVVEVRSGEGVWRAEFPFSAEP